MPADGQKVVSFPRLKSLVKASALMEERLSAVRDIFGDDSLEVAELLEKYAGALKIFNARLSDAASMELQAKEIRRRLDGQVLPMKKPTIVDIDERPPAGIEVAAEQCNKLHLAETGMKECPLCAEWIKERAILCRYCQHYLPARGDL